MALVWAWNWKIRVHGCMNILLEKWLDCRGLGVGSRLGRFRVKEFGTMRVQLGSGSGIRWAVQGGWGSGFRVQGGVVAVSGRIGFED